ncbi:MAG: RNase adapter RapZ [Gammaproteobacteria bacterium]|nr:RNase adapter RapZ [Gammaproteobacteria bacterium]
MKLIIISGLSGSGKSVALHTLEDEEYYCVDNLPPALLPSFVDEIHRNPSRYQKSAVGIDARTISADFESLPQFLQELRNHHADINAELVFLDADIDELIKRFSETRRRHPLSTKGLPLIDAINLERTLLSAVKEQADLVIDTTTLNVHDLRKLVVERVRPADTQTALSVLFQSFGYKNGVPGDSDFVFDARCLPNPHWVPELRPLSGQDAEVAAFLQQQPVVEEMLQSIISLLETWLPRYEAEKRRYITVSIGCNGGQHRSVYLTEQLKKHFAEKQERVSVRHRELQ